MAFERFILISHRVVTVCWIAPVIMVTKLKLELVLKKLLMMVLSRERLSAVAVVLLRCFCNILVALCGILVLVYDICFR